LEQICTHCCSTGHTWVDEDQYRSLDTTSVRKVACDADHHGISNGVCDGFGSCQCAPPFFGLDCSMKDCRNNCSAHGWCDIAYPVSRCMCDSPFFGEWCQYKHCLNNCSYPNGECDIMTGECVCNSVWNPYNSSRRLEGEIWNASYQGIDCSYLTAFAEGSQVAPNIFFFRIIFIKHGTLGSWDILKYRYKVMVEMMSLCSAVHHALPVRIVRSPWNVYNMFQKCIKLDTEMYWVTCTGRVT
jgi:hypothetical protein